MATNDRVQWYDIEADCDREGVLGDRMTAVGGGDWDGVAFWEVYDENGTEFMVEESVLKTDAWH